MRLSLAPARRLAVCSVAVAGLVLTASPLLAQNAFLLDDLQPFGAANEGSQPSFLYRVGDRAVLTAYEPGAGSSLWSTDGTSAGTARLTALPENAAPIGELFDAPLWIGRKPGRPGLTLWLSDAVDRGTHEVLPPELRVELGADQPAAGHYDFFVTVGHRTELWRTDGRHSGHHRIAELGERSPDGPRVAGSRLFFFASEGARLSECSGHDVPDYCDEPLAWKLWVSDGTSAGTRAIAPAGAAPRYAPPARINLVTSTGVFFSVVDPNEPDTDLYWSDGTPAGTRRLAHFDALYALQQMPRFAAIAGKAYFVADDPVIGTEVWVSDGTPGGTRRITDLPAPLPFNDTLNPDQIAAAGGRILFPAGDSVHGRELWSTDGRPASTLRLTDSCPEICDGLDAGAPLRRLAGPPFENQLIFAARNPGGGIDLWTSDGSLAGTRPFYRPGGSGYVSPYLRLDHGVLFFLLADAAHGSELAMLGPGMTAPVRLTNFANPMAFEGLTINGFRLGSHFVFVADDGTHGQEPWVTSLASSTVTARLLTDITVGSGPSSSPLSFTRLGERALFFACHGDEVALWATDGQPDGSRALHPLQVPCSSFPGNSEFSPPAIVVAGGLAFHHADAEGQVWRSDGTPAGTFPVSHFGPSPPYALVIAGPVRFGERVVFAHLLFDPDSQAISWELWESDGSLAGTRPLFTLSADNGLFHLFGGEDRFYLATTAGTDVILRGSDGTEAGTRVLIPSGGDARVPFAEFVRFRGDDYFRWGDALWRTDGTPEGTEPLSSLFLPGLGREPSAITVFDDALYLFNESQPTGQVGLWRTDGTLGGTQLLVDFGYAGVLGPLTPVAGRLFFLAMAGDGQGAIEQRLWQSDGTPAGTFPFGPELDGPSSDVVPLAGRLYFAASDPAHGNELWQSDGTADGTQLSQDIAPGPLSSGPRELFALDDRLLFSADDGLSGREPWVLVPESPGCTPGPTVLCLAEGRFRAEVVFQDPDGRSLAARPEPLSSEVGAFSFFQPGNLDALVKVLDGSAVSGHGWVFVGSLSDASFTLTLTDTTTGAARRYRQLRAQLTSFVDLTAFDLSGHLRAGEVALPKAEHPRSVASESFKSGDPPACVPAADHLCLLHGRFAVEVLWRRPGSPGEHPFERAAMIPASDGTGLFWFFRPGNLEGAVKMVDGTAINDHVWLFFTGLTDLEIDLRIADTRTGGGHAYHKPAGQFVAFADLGRF